MGFPHLLLTICCLISTAHSAPTLHGHGHEEHEHEEEFVCSHDFKMLRCQKENFNRTILHNFRLTFNWTHSPQSVHRIACMCNNIAEEKGFPYFGLSFYGLCNGFHTIDKTAEEGVCYDGNLDVCDTDVDRECDGGPLYEALYRTGSLKNAKYITHDKKKELKVVKPADAKCPSGYRFRKLACQKEDFARIPLFNDRDYIQWNNFVPWLKSFVCKCRAYAKANRFEYFSVSFWGLCGGLDKHGHKLTTDPSDCKRSVTGNITRDTCDLDKEDEACVGKGFADVVYDTETHPCDRTDKGGCEQKCVRNEDDYYCSCNDGFKMVKENHQHVCKSLSGLGEQTNEISIPTTTLHGDNVIYTFATLPKIYTVSFSLKLTGTELGWLSVLHFTVGGNRNNMGDLLPGVFVNEDTLEISSSVNSPNNVVLYKNFPLNKWIDVRVMYSKIGTEYWYIVYVDGKQIKHIRNTTPQTYSNVKVYYGDRWYSPFYGMVRDLKVIVHK